MVVTIILVFNWNDSTFRNEMSQREKLNYSKHKVKKGGIPFRSDVVLKDSITIFKTILFYNNRF